MNNHSKGAEWHKWDLHVHSNASDGKGNAFEIIQEAKRKGLSVIALTDHHTAKNIDDIKIEAAKENITVISGIEFRTEYGQSSVHMIGLFPDEHNGVKLNSVALHDLILSPLNISETVIKQKGKDAGATTDVEAFEKGMFLVQVPFKDAADIVHKYGGIISVHAGTKENSLDNEMKHFGGSLKNVKHLYDSLGTVKNDLFKDGYIDICEIRKENDSEEFYLKMFGKPSIIASDAHKITEIGQKFTWIKADTTFEGLRQIINEPDRIFLGDEPEIIERIKNNRTKYISNLRINSVVGYDGKYGKWFQNVDIKLNPELVAIIGHKGSGKSAIADIIALCANYKNQNDFSFLSRNKFKDGKHAKNFEATIIWESTNQNKKQLDYPSDDTEIELVKYLPQGYFERLTNEISSVQEFQKEIENVVFTYLDDDVKLGVSSFDVLIEKKKENINHEISILKERLSVINKSIVEKEKKLNTTYRDNIEAQIKKKKEELVALIEPAEVKNPNDDPAFAEQNQLTNIKIETLNKTILSLSEEINGLNNEKFSLLIDLEEIKNTKQKIKSKETEMTIFSDSIKVVFDKYDIIPNDVISYQFSYAKIDTLLVEKETKLTQIKIKLGEETSENTEYVSLNKQLYEKNNELKLIQDSLNDVAKKYQSFLTAKKIWEENKRKIIGNENSINSLLYLEKELKYISTDLVNEISQARESRFEIVKSIFDNMKTILDIYKDIKTKIDSIISTNENTLNQYRINIDASFTFKYNFQSKFLSFVSLNKTGTFYGKENGEIQINKITEGTNLDDFEQLKVVLSNITESFFEDKKNNKITFIDNQVDNIIELYDYLFSLDFIDFNYQLKQGNKNLEQLSPGEKGALLLIFYLLLDNNDIPLIIDQPEDNLDNNSVANILVPFIKKAKLKRQIILVTHNPNLAVVADAEQVIYVHLEKENDNLFSFISGSIENREVNDCIVKVLEGAMPAFNKRKQKYYE